MVASHDNLGLVRKGSEPLRGDLELAEAAAATEVPSVNEDIPIWNAKFVMEEVGVGDGHDSHALIVEDLPSGR
jgi:hypothetical protein